MAFPHDGPWNDALKPGVDLDAVGYADIPHAGEKIERGQPVMTVFASAPTAEQCRANLQEKSQALDRCLWG
jgi:predicted ATP-grasp superfamily ATP-dependent carboligase